MEWLKHSGVAFLQAGGATALIMAFCPKEYWPAAFALVAFALKMRGIQIPPPGGVDAAIANGDSSQSIRTKVHQERTATGAFKNPLR